MSFASQMKKMATAIGAINLRFVTQHSYHHNPTASK